jgi:hypothetical protein
MGALAAFATVARGLEAIQGFRGLGVIYLK